MNKIMEYMALGKPIVQLTWPRAAIPRSSPRCTRRNNAFDFASKIVELLDDRDKRSAMGAYGRRRVENELEWRYEVQKLLAAYDALWTRMSPRARYAT